MAKLTDLRINVDIIGTEAANNMLDIIAALQTRNKGLQKGHATLTRKNQELEKQLEEDKAPRGSLHITGTGMEGRDADGGVTWRFGLIKGEDKQKAVVDKASIENRIQRTKEFLNNHARTPRQREYAEKDLAIFEMALRSHEAEEYATDAQMRVLALTRETLEKDKRIEEMQEKLNEANRKAGFFERQSLLREPGHAASATDINTARLADDIKRCSNRLDLIEGAIKHASGIAVTETTKQLQQTIHACIEKGIRQALQPGGLLHK